LFSKDRVPSDKDLPLSLVESVIRHVP
jgi:hypothetical protein